MIVLNIKCKNPEEMAKFRDRMCEALGWLTCIQK